METGRTIVDLHIWTLERCHVVRIETIYILREILNESFGALELAGAWRFTSARGGADFEAEGGGAGTDRLRHHARTTVTFMPCLP